MLGGDGEARGGVLPSVEAQQREGCSNAAMCHTFSLSYFDFSSQEEEKEEEEGKRGWRPYLPTTNAWWWRKACLPAD